MVGLQLAGELKSEMQESLEASETATKMSSEWDLKKSKSSTVRTQFTVR